ncbi:MAG: UpxY family transcription antiterminator [Bacteroidales bacterium]
MHSPLSYHWYAVYTRPRSEKKAHEQIAETGVECYLPLVKTLKQWSDRKKWMHEPLFRSYLFVYVSEKERYEVLNCTPHAIRYISFEGKAVPIPPQQIEAIRTFINQGENLDLDMDLSRYEPGQPVEIIEGAMKGLQGNLVRILGKQKVRIEITGVGKAVYVEIPAAFLRFFLNHE